MGSVILYRCTREIVYLVCGQLGPEGSVSAQVHDSVKEVLVECT